MSGSQKKKKKRAQFTAQEDGQEEQIYEHGLDGNIGNKKAKDQQQKMNWLPGKHCS